MLLTRRCPNVAPVATAALARNFYHLLDRHRIDEAVRILDDRFRGHGMGSDRDGFRAEATAWLEAFPDLRISICQLVTDSAAVAARLALHGTHQGRFAGLPASGRAVEVGSCDVFRVRDGKIVKAWWLGNSGSMLMQIGAVPMPSQA